MVWIRSDIEQRKMVWKRSGIMNNRGKPVSKKVPLLTELRTKKEVYLMILPFSLFFIVFVVAPVLFSVVMSFTDYNVIQSPGFVGLDN